MFNCDPTWNILEMEMLQATGFNHAALECHRLASRGRCVTLLMDPPPTMYICCGTIVYLVIALSVEQRAFFCHERPVLKRLSFEVAAIIVLRMPFTFGPLR